MNTIIKTRYNFSRSDLLGIRNIITKSEYWKDYAVAHAAECKDEDCEYCQHLCDQGLIESCDSCGVANHTDALDFWRGNLVGDQCFIYCPNC